MPGKKIMAIFAIMVALALSACVEQGTENQTGEISAAPETPTGVPPAGSETPAEAPSSEVVQQPRRQDTNETPVEEPIAPEEPITPPEEPEPTPAEEPGAQPAGTEEVPGFEAYLALGAIGLAGAAVALTHRKKKE